MYRRARLSTLQRVHSSCVQQLEARVAHVHCESIQDVPAEVQMTFVKGAGWLVVHCIRVPATGAEYGGGSALC